MSPEILAKFTDTAKLLPHLAFAITPDCLQPILIGHFLTPVEAVECCEDYQISNPECRSFCAQLRYVFSTEVVHTVNKIWI